jgi:4-alpha-glucanotransferase
VTTYRLPRACGLLLHPTSLPGPDGIGTLDGHLEQWLDFLAAAGQTYWQILPLVPTGYGDSPYAGLSAFAGTHC